MDCNIFEKKITIFLPQSPTPPILLEVFSKQLYLREKQCIYDNWRIVRVIKLSILKTASAESTTKQFATDTYIVALEYVRIHTHIYNIYKPIYRYSVNLFCERDATLSVAVFLTKYNNL